MEDPPKGQIIRFSPKSFEKLLQKAFEEILIKTARRFSRDSETSSGLLPDPADRAGNRRGARAREFPEKGEKPKNLNKLAAEVADEVDEPVSTVQKILRALIGRLAVVDISAVENIFRRYRGKA